MPSGQALSSPADEAPPGQQRPQRQSRPPTYSLRKHGPAVNVCLYSFQLAEPYDLVTVENSSDHLSVSSCLVTSQLAWFSLLADPLVFDTIHVTKLDASHSTHDE